MRLHQMPGSGNCYKVDLALTQLAIPCERVDLDIRTGVTRSPAFLSLNPAGRVPLLELDDGTTLAESNAILFYLATGTSLLPEDRLQRARVLQWMFFEQYSHEPYIATTRYWIKFLGEAEARRARIEENRERGHAALAVMERHLAQHPFFVGAYSIADIALFAYTHVAHEGGFDLSPYPKLLAWLDRVRETPGFVPMAA
ncbi:MAG: glutathione S-transferase family protein [Pseudomonadales bacterium]|nr:glutathione S-transferase family protein [Pseudomonadales bacterium]